MGDPAHATTRSGGSHTDPRNFAASHVCANRMQAPTHDERNCTCVHADSNCWNRNEHQAVGMTADQSTQAEDARLEPSLGQTPRSSHDGEMDYLHEPRRPQQAKDLDTSEQQTRTC